MATSKGKVYGQRFRKASFVELCRMLDAVASMPSGAVVELATVVFMCAPPPPELRELWRRAAESMRTLRDWLVEHEHNPLSSALINRLLREYGFEEYRIWEGTPHGLGGPVISADMPHKEKPGYDTLLKLGVDVLCRHGLALQRGRGKNAGPSALEVMAEVLYWVWRDPDERAAGEKRDHDTLARRYREAVRWAREREEQGRRLPMIEELEAYRTAEIGGEHVRSIDLEPGASANARQYVWIPDRGAEAATAERPEATQSVTKRGGARERGGGGGRGEGG